MPFLKVIKAEKKACNCIPDCKTVYWLIEVELPDGQKISREISSFKYNQILLFNEIYEVLKSPISLSDIEAERLIKAIQSMSDESFELGYERGTKETIIASLGSKLPLPSGIKSISELVEKIMSGLAKDLSDGIGIIDIVIQKDDSKPPSSESVSQINDKIVDSLNRRRN